MNTLSDDALMILNGLIESCCDAAKAFREAAEEARQPEIKRLLASLSSQRSHFVDELHHYLRSTKREAELLRRTPGPVYPGWLRLLAAVSSGSALAILTECEAGEVHMVGLYYEALAKLVEPRATEVVRFQAVQVQASHDWVRDLRDAAS